MIARTPAPRLVPLLLLLAAAPSRAAADGVTVLGIEPEDVPVAEAATMASALRRAIRERPDTNLVNARDFVEMKFVFGCMDPSAFAACLAPAARSLRAELFIVGTLSARRVRLQIVDTILGRVIRTADEPVDGDRGEVARRLADALLGPRPARSSSGSRRRTAFIAGGVALGLAAVAGGVAFYTWRRYSALQAEATNDLDLIYRANPSQRQTDAAWFAKANCDPPADLPRGSLVEGYVAGCREGSSLADATTGLLVGVGVLGAVAAGSFIAGGVGGGDGPRVTAIAPWIRSDGGGLVTSLEF